MAGGPLDAFGALLRVCVRDDGPARSVGALFTVTAVSFAMGVLSSGLTAYLLGAAHVAL